MTTRVSARRADEPAPARFTVVDELNCYFDSPEEPNNVHLEVWLPERLDAGRLRDAVTAVLGEQPKARGRRATPNWSRRGFAWEFPPGGDLDPVTVTHFDQDAGLDRARVRFLATAPPVDHSPPFRLLLASGPEHDSLILNAHHAAFDGHSCLRLLRLIGARYSGVPPGRAPSTPPAAEPAAQDEPEPGQAPGSRWQAARASLRPAARIAPQHPAATPGYGFALLGWPGVPTPPPRPDGPRVTVNDLLIAALIETIARWNEARQRKPGRIRITMPVNARPPGDTDQLGNLSRLCTITAGGEAALTAVASQTEQAKRRSGPPVGPALAAVVKAPIPVPVKRGLLTLAMRTVGRVECDTSLLTNLGRLTDPPRFGDVAPGSMWFSTSTHMPRGLSVGAITVADQLRLCFRYRYALLDDAAAREFTAGYRAALSRLAGWQEPAP
jgi:NRPS condensation-like uncharacterized protein